MVSATIGIGYNQSAVVAGVAQTQQSIESVSKSVAKANAAAEKSNRAFSRNLGGVSMQASDIAVQLQGGTSAAVVLAQQGSQIASYFGPAGMVAGGVVAIGAGLYTMGQKGKEAFDGLVKETSMLHLEMSKIDSASMPQLTEWADKSKASIAKLGEEMKNTHTFLGGITALLGGDTVFNRRKVLGEAQKTAAEDEAATNAKAVQVSQQDLSITMAKLKGDQEAAINAETRIELARKLAKIEESSFSPQTKKKLSADAVQGASAEAAAKLAAIAKTRQAEQEAGLNARASMTSNLAILQAQADGNTKVAEALQRQQTIRERAVAIENQLGVSKATALGIAKQEADLKDQAAKVVKHDERKPGHIMGFSAKRGDKVHGFDGLGGAKFEGLERYKRLQAGGHFERKFAAFDDGFSLDTLTSPKRLAMAKAREKTGGGMKGVDAGTQKEMVAILERIAASVAPLGAL